MGHRVSSQWWFRDNDRHGSTHSAFDQSYAAEVPYGRIRSRTLSQSQHAQDPTLSGVDMCGNVLLAVGNLQAVALQYESDFRMSES